MDLSGVEKEKIDIEVSNGRLSIRGNRSVPSYGEPETAHDKGKLRVHMMEIDHGRFFSRGGTGPKHVAQSKIEAHYRKRMLCD